MKKSDWIFIAPIIILSLNFIYRLANFATIMWRFPLDYVNDLSSYVSLLHFLKVYGYQNIVPDWYNGFILLKVYPPAWYFFTYPFLLLSGDVMIAAFISTILLFILGFIGVWFLGKQLQLSTIKTLALYVFIFANPITIGAIFKQGRLPALMAMVLMIALITLLLSFKEHKPTLTKLLFLALLFAALLLTHSPEVLLFGVLFCGLLLIKNNKERIYLTCALIIGIILSSWWLVGFLENIQSGVLSDSSIKSKWLLDFSGGFLFGNISLIILPIALLVLFGIYYLQNKSKKELLFYLPLLTLTVLVLFRLVIFIPIIKQVYLDIYQDLFVLFCSIFLVAINWERFSKKILIALACALILVSSASVAYNMTITPFNEPYTDLNYDMLAMLERVNETYVIVSTKEDPSSSYEKAYYCYGAIYLGKKTGSGWGPWYKLDDAYIKEVKSLGYKELQGQTCDSIKQHLTNLQTTQVISYDEGCTYFANTCNLTLIASQGRACLLTVH